MSKKVEESIRTTLRNERYKKDPSWKSRHEKYMEFKIWKIRNCKKLVNLKTEMESKTKHLEIKDFEKKEQNFSELCNNTNRLIIPNMGLEFQQE